MRPVKELLAPSPRLRLAGWVAQVVLQVRPGCRMKQQLPGSREKVPGAVPMLVSPTLTPARAWAGCCAVTAANREVMLPRAAGATAATEKAAAASWTLRVGGALQLQAKLSWEGCWVDWAR